MSWYSTLNDESCSDPGSVAKELSRIPDGRNNPLWGRANSYCCPVGPEPGVAFVALRRTIAHQLADDFCTLKFRDDQGSVEFPGLLPVRVIDVVGSPYEEEAMCLVELHDRRAACRMSAIDRDYNVRQPAPYAPNQEDSEYYYKESLDHDSVWDWQGIVTDITEYINEWFGSADLPTGIEPNLPPTNYRYAGWNAWDALHDILDHLGCTTAYNPITDKFRIVAVGAAQDGLDEALEACKVRMKLDYNPANQFNSTSSPRKLEVYFPRKERYGTEKDTVREGNWEHQRFYKLIRETNIDGTIGILPIHDRLEAEIDENGDVTNLEHLDRRADYYNSAYQQATALRLGRHFVGACSSILPGERVSQVKWRDYGDEYGLVTEVTGSFPLAPKPPKAETHRQDPAWPLYPHVMQVIKIIDPSSEEESCGKVISANGEKLFQGVVQRQQWDKTEELEPCWVRFYSSGDDAGDTQVAAGSFWFGRLFGTAVSGTQEFPLYVVIDSGRKGQPARVTETITKASSTSVGSGKVQLMTVETDTSIDYAEEELEVINWSNVEFPAPASGAEDFRVYVDYDDCGRLMIISSECP